MCRVQLWLACRQRHSRALQRMGRRMLFAGSAISCTERGEAPAEHARQKLSGLTLARHLKHG